MKTFYKIPDYALNYTAKAKVGDHQTFAIAPNLIDRLAIVNWIAGVVLIAEAMLHIYLVFHLTAIKFLAISPIIKFVSIGLYLLVFLGIRKFLKQK